MLVLEGTWEEVSTQAVDLAGRRVRLTVLPGDAAVAGQQLTPTNRDLLACLEELDADDQMPVTPAAPSAVNLIREGRAGPMYGYDPGE